MTTYRVAEINDEFAPYPGPEAVAAIAYDGDPDVFVALAWAHLAERDIGLPIQPPRYTRYRWEPDPTRYHASLLRERPEGGRGTWAGASLVVNSR